MPSRVQLAMSYDATDGPGMAHFFNRLADTGQAHCPVTSRGPDLYQQWCRHNVWHILDSQDALGYVCLATALHRA
jgi:hypothetical protein